MHNLSGETQSGKSGSQAHARPLTNVEWQELIGAACALSGDQLVLLILMINMAEREGSHLVRASVDTIARALDPFLVRPGEGTLPQRKARGMACSVVRRRVCELVESGWISPCGVHCWSLNVVTILQMVADLGDEWRTIKQ